MTHWNRYGDITDLSVKVTKGKKKIGKAEGGGETKELPPASE